MLGMQKVCMQNILEHNKIRSRRIIWGFMIIFMAPMSLAVSGQPPEFNIQEKSKPVFDPDLFDQNQNFLEGRDEFLAKLQKKRADFNVKQNFKKRQFFQSLNQKNLSPEEQQQEILKFHQKQIEQSKKLQDKQTAKLEKHQEKVVEGDLVRKLEKERHQFLAKQQEQKKEFLDKLQRRDEGYDIFKEELAKFEDKQLKARNKFLKKQSKKRKND